MDVQALSVSDLILEIKTNLETRFPDNTVVGEISNLSHSSAGHYYFNLSDDKSSVSCALFKMDAFRNPAIRKIKNGDKVLVRGPIGLYARRGTFQIICKRILPYGVGNLMAQYEMLKQKLRAEGLFDQDLKRKIPENVSKIAVITALRGAALQDFLNVMKTKGLWYQITIIPSVVQGDACAPSIIKSIEKAIRLEVDVIVVTRGGGSMEDLWGFNDENLVRFVAKSPIPIVSAVGHQVDYTLIDFASDMRCETPSTAAALLIQGQQELYKRLNFASKDLKSLFFSFKNKVFQRIQKVNPIKVLHLLRERVHRANTRLERVSILQKEDPIGLHEYSMEIDDYMERLKRFLEGSTRDYNHKLNVLSGALKVLDPKNVLSRGYTYLETEKNGSVLSSLEEFDKLDQDELLVTHFKDGKAKVRKV